MNRGLHTLLTGLAGAFAGAGLMLMSGVLADRDSQPPAVVTPPAPRHSLLDEVAERIRLDYVEPVADRNLEEAAVEGIVASLDPHSAFLDVDAYDAMRASTSGSYTGVGIEVADEDGRIVVLAPIEGSPAERAGVLTGDRIVAVDEQPVAAGDLEGTIRRMRGRPGTHVKLAVARESAEQPLVFDLERSEVHLHTVRAQALPGDVGYVRITQFSDSTPVDLAGALAQLRADSPAMRGLVLDLRGNPGGVLESAVAVADEFLEAGAIVKANGRTPEARFQLDATAGDALSGAPIVVLVDRGSASGAEIVAGALRDHQRATLMGERTYGKGSVQTVIPLQGGQALKLTTSRYFTPSGASIHELGLEPDVLLELPSTESPLRAAADAAVDPAVLSALQYLRDRGLVAQLAPRS